VANFIKLFWGNLRLGIKKLVRLNLETPVSVAFQAELGLANRLDPRVDLINFLWCKFTNNLWQARPFHKDYHFCCITMERSSLQKE
jgi:hypothetical protein